MLYDTGMISYASNRFSQYCIGTFVFNTGYAIVIPYTAGHIIFCVYVYVDRVLNCALTRVDNLHYVLLVITISILNKWY
jgi:hypothetical protein